MKYIKSTLPTAFFAGTALAFASMPVAADTLSTVTQAVNLFENGQATGGHPMTVDAKGPVKITDAVELPSFAFAVYDVDLTSDSVTMTLTADLAELKITLYDDTTFDRYYFAFDHEVTAAEVSDTTDENFSAKPLLMQRRRN